MSERRGFDKIVGQDLAKHMLTKAVRESSPTHAYLFLGLEGTGKNTTATEFAKALNCETPQDGNACGECALCHAFEHGNAADVRTWSPDKKKKNTTIEQMREMREQAVFKPVRGKWRVNIVEQGDTLNDESANCILKLLEEPPEYLVNIILYRNAASILPTIRSRCQLVRFTQVGSAELVDRLLDDHGANDEEARVLAAYSQGCPGKAIALVGNREFLARRDEIIEIASAASSRDMWRALKLAEMLRGTSKKSDDEPEDGETSGETDAEQSKKHWKTRRDTVIESLDILVTWYRDLLAAKLQGLDAALVNTDRRDDVVAQSERYPHAGRLANIVEAILRAKRVILGNGNAQIVTEALMMRLTV